MRPGVRAARLRSGGRLADVRTSEGERRDGDVERLRDWGPELIRGCLVCYIILGVEDLTPGSCTYMCVQCMDAWLVRSHVRF